MANNNTRSSSSNSNDIESLSTTELLEELTGEPRPWPDYCRSVGRSEVKTLRKRVLLSRCDEDYARQAKNQTCLDVSRRGIKIKAMLWMSLLLMLWMGLVSLFDTPTQIQATIMNISILVWVVQWFVLRVCASGMSSQHNRQPAEMFADMLALAWPMGAVLTAENIFDFNMSHWLDVTVVEWAQANLSDGVRFSITFMAASILAYFIHCVICAICISNELSWEDSLDELERESRNPMTEMYAKRKALEEKEILSELTAQTANHQKSLRRL